MDGLTATRMIKDETPSIAVIMVTTYESKDYLRSAIEAGAAGYMLKGMSREALINGVRLVMEGGAFVDAQLLREFLREFRSKAGTQGAAAALEGLSPRETEVLGLLARGLTNKEIAREIGYSVGTVKNVVQRVIEKLGVSDRTQAAVQAVYSGLAVD